jgi:pimeloyl-ACP methyl ester carboxylesterase
MRAPRWLRVTSGVALLCALVVVATGAIYERLARRTAGAEVPGPGRMVDVGQGRRLQMDCRGSGSPTVVLESGLDTYGSTAWLAVLDSIALTSRVCAYSRAGVMWSDARHGDYDAERGARELHRALESAGERAPYVMVAHSLGGPYAMIFTRLFPEDVSGLVLVDPTHPDQFARFRDETGKDLAPPADYFRVIGAIAWTGVIRLAPAAPVPPGWPDAVRSLVPRFLPTSVAALAGEVGAIPTTLAQAGKLRSLGDRPLIVLSAVRDLTAGELAQLKLTPEQGARVRSTAAALHADLARLSTRGELRRVESSHYIQYDRPEVVIAAVREVSRPSRMPVPERSRTPSP